MFNALQNYKHMKRKIITAIICMLVTLTAYPLIAQQTVVEFQYDAAGNRVLRHVIELPPENDKETQQNREVSDTTEITYTETIGQTEINIYPNPNGGRFTVVIHNPETGKKASLALYTVTGALVLKRDLLTSKTEIDIRNRENGPYMLSIAIDGKRKTWKVIKQ